MALLSCIEIEPNTTAQASVIWLHGLGANGHDFAGILPELNLPKNHAIRFIFPHAPRRPITINMGYVMPAWYDILALELDSPEDSDGIRQAQQYINALIEHERERGISADKIILAGFSQGGALALQTGLRYPEKLAGMLVLSAYLPLAKTVATEASVANQQTPIFIMHGTQDDIVPLSWGELTRDLISQLDYPVNWETYPMGHSVCLPQIKTIGNWLTDRLSMPTM